VATKDLRSYLARNLIKKSTKVVSTIG
jgi:hypothetical protein